MRYTKKHRDPKTVKIELRLTTPELRAFKEAAAGIPLSTWVRESLRNAAVEALDCDQCRSDLSRQ